MATYLPKQRGDILRNALRRIEKDTPIKATTVGSVARAFTEAITNEISDFYDLLDYNLAQSTLSTASGRHLDMIGDLYNLKRGTVTDSVQVSRESGSFYFYVDEPATSPITIPRGTRVYTSSENFVGRQLSFSTTGDVTIATGETRVFSGLQHDFATNEVTAAPGSLTVTDMRSPVPGVVVKCTNPKPIYSQSGYESDNNLRSRIIKRLEVQATGNINAIRFSLLGRPNIRDVRIHSARLGLGVVEVMVVPEENAFTRDQIAEITNIVESSRPGGVRVMVTSPERLTAEIKSIIFLRQSQLQQGDSSTILARCNAAWKNHLNSLLPGQPLVYNRLIDIAMGISDKVADVTITEVRVGGSSIIRSNYTPKSDQMVVPGNIDIVTSIYT